MKNTFKSLRRVLVLFLAALLMAPGCLGIPQAFAREYQDFPQPVYESGAYSYELTGDQTAVIVDYDGKETAIRIPAELDGYPVSEIGKDAFSYYEMDRLEIPAGITVSGQAFQYCVVRDELTLPEGGVIRSRAFEYAELPTTLTIPAGAVVGDNCFSYCERLTALFLEPRAAVKGRAFSYSEDLKNVVCASGSVIADNSFYGCDRLEQLALCGDAALTGRPFRDSSAFETLTLKEKDYEQTVKSAAEQALEPSIKPGCIEGNLYVNKSLRLECLLPRRWSVATPEELAAGMGISAEEFGQPGSLVSYLETYSSWTDLLAGTKTGEQLSVSVAPLPEELKEAMDYLTMEELAAAQGISVTALLSAKGYGEISFLVDEDYDDFPIDEYSCVLFQTVENGETVSIRQVFYLVDDALVTVTAISRGADSTVELLRYFLG